MMQAFLEDAQDASINPDSAETKRGGKRSVQSQILSEMMAIDRECALETMKVWAKFFETGSSRQQNKIFTSIDKYLPYRVMDWGER